MKPRQAELLSEVLRRVVRGLDMETKLESHAVGPAWERAVGSRLAPHTRATKLRDSVLTIEARSASWLNEISLMRNDIRERLNAELGRQAVHEIRFRLGGAFPPLATVVPPPEASPLEIESARRTLAAAGDAGAELAARAYVLRSKGLVR